MNQNQYFVYENWVAEGHKARIHFGSCGHCNYGRGVHPEAGDRNGKWFGPFTSFADAKNAAYKTGGYVSCCKHCNPI